MKRVLVLLAVSVACLAVAGTVAAQDTQGTYRISWDNCDPQVVNKDWAGVAIYKIVLSGDNFTPGDAIDNNVGTDFNIDFRPVTPPLPDAWRFDDVGCQTGSQLILSSNALSKACAAFKGLNPLAITFYGADVANPAFAQLRLAITYDMFSPTAGLRYTFWQISFDHSYSTVNPTTPGVDCGEVDQPLCIAPTFAILLTQRGISAQMQLKAGDSGFVTWQSPATCNGIPSVPATWGKVKGLYR